MDDLDEEVFILLIFIPIERLHIEHSIVLGNITIISKDVLIESDNIVINNKAYSSSLLNKLKVLNLFNESFAVYQTDNLDNCIYCKEFADNLRKTMYYTFDTCVECKNLVDNLIRPVDYALDSLRISLNSFKFHEQVIGTPGFYKGNKVVVVTNDDFESYKIIKGKEVYYELSEGIGCDANGFYTDKNDILLYPRKDEVYVKYRNILHRLFKAIQIYDVNTCFAYLFSTIEGLDCKNSYSFKDKKIRILSFIVKNQNEFNILSEQFYFYSKTVRTDIIHKGKSLYDILPWKKIYELLDDLYLLVIRFCMASIESGAKNFSELNEKICDNSNLFSYDSLKDDIEKNEIPVTVSGKCDYFAEVNNLNIDSCLKIGETLFLPANSKDRIKEFYQIYDYGSRLCIANDLDEKELVVDRDFPKYHLFSNFNMTEQPFTVWDVGVIVTVLLRNIGISSPFAIIENQHYWKQNTVGFDHSYCCEFSDVICNTIQKTLNYLILLSDLKKDTILPSKVGINNFGIRGAYINPERSSSIDFLPGRVYGEYVEPDTLFIPSLTNYSELLYNCFFSSRTDEVFSINCAALNRIAESIYFHDINQTIITIFEALDMLYPTTHDGNKLIKRIATFCCETQKEKNTLVKELKALRENVRNPILHGGKSISDLKLNEDDAYAKINRIKDIVIKYCKNTFLLNINTFKDLHEEEKSKNKILLT